MKLLICVLLVAACTQPAEPGQTVNVKGSYEADGLTLDVEQMWFASADDTKGTDFERFMQGAPTLVVATVTVSNEAGRTVDFFPNQGRLQIGREQADADLFSSDDIGGTFNDGTDSSGRVLWRFKTAADELMEEGAAELTVLQPDSSDTVTVELAWES